MKDAFTGEEQEAILTTDVVNRDNPDYQTPGGNTTKDQVYLLSRDEVTRPEYGFASSADDQARNRRALNTDFAEGRRVELDSVEEGPEDMGWWLRSPGYNNGLAAVVGGTGKVPKLGNSVQSFANAVRPALHLNLASVTSDSYAGTVTSKGETETPTTPNVTVAPTEEPRETSAPQLTYDLTVKTSGNGAVTLKTSGTTITTDGNASIDLKVNGGGEVLLTFQPAAGCLQDDPCHHKRRQEWKCKVRESKPKKGQRKEGKYLADPGERGQRVQTAAAPQRGQLRIQPPSGSIRF